MTELFAHFGGVTVFGAIVAFIAAAFGIGHLKGKSAAEKESTERETKAMLDDIKASSEARQQSASEARNVTENVTRMSDSDVDNRLRDKWRLPPGNGD